MSSKTAARRWSIRARLTLCFGAAACALAGTVAATNYWLLAAQRDQDTDEWLTDAAAHLHAEQEKGWSAGSDWTEEPFRAIGPDRRIRYESSSICAIALADAFPEPGPVGICRSVGDKRYRLICTRIDGWTYQLASDQTADSHLFARYRRNLLLAVVPTVLAGLSGGYLLTWWGFRPLREMTEAVRGIAPSRIGDRIPVAGLPAELAAVAEAFNGVMDRLQDAFARLDQFSADIAHELRTPIHNLRGGIEVALGQDRTPDNYRTALGAALNEADRLGRLVDRLLHLAQAEDPRREVRRETTDIAEQLNDVQEFFAPMATEKGVTLGVGAPPGLSFSLDRALFQRAVSNLVSNALAHTPAGGEVQLGARPDEAGLWVSVADTGTGILPEDVPHLFDRYFRSRAARAAGRGVGLGLAIVRRVIELHGGSVMVDSEPGRGTVVCMSFPPPSEMTPMSFSRHEGDRSKEYAPGSGLEESPELVPESKSCHAVNFSVRASH
jgi:two-component system heavy metal sensor histidine kinase CusS